MSNIELSQAERLDRYVVSQLPLLSRAFVGKLIDEGKVRVNGEPVTKSGYKLRLNDQVDIDYKMEDLPEIPEIELEILYVDDDCVVINKPLGLLVHSKGAYNPEPTVATWLMSHIASSPWPVDEEGDQATRRAGIVHRLDRATSGVMIVAKNPKALSFLQKQFAIRKVKKTYTALVAGVMKEKEAIIDMPIERNPKAPQMFRVGANGKNSITQYKVLKEHDDVSLLELKPTTGRTHQLRVHLHHIGHPIIGDTLYEGRPAERLFLHATHLEITLPNRQRKTFSAPIPKEFNDYLMNHE